MTFQYTFFQINPHIHLDQFSHKVSFHDNFVTSGYDLDYPLIIMKITLKRNIGYHVLQTFVPSSLFVILGEKSEKQKLGNKIFLLLGYLSLYVPAESIPGRVAIGMTTILTLTAMFSGIRHTVPKVSYISYIDIWMVMCLIYVNFFMFEFVLVAYLRSIKREALSRLVEKRCRVIFPLSFFLFNILYWPLVTNI